MAQRGVDGLPLGTPSPSFAGALTPRSPYPTPHPQAPAPLRELVASLARCNPREPLSVSPDELARWPEFRLWAAAPSSVAAWLAPVSPLSPSGRGGDGDRDDGLFDDGGCPWGVSPAALEDAVGQDLCVKTHELGDVGRIATAAAVAVGGSVGGGGDGGGGGVDDAMNDGAGDGGGGGRGRGRGGEGDGGSGGEPPLGSTLPQPQNVVMHRSSLYVPVGIDPSSRMLTFAVAVEYHKQLGDVVPWPTLPLELRGVFDTATHEALLLGRTPEGQQYASWSVEQREGIILSSQSLFSPPQPGSWPADEASTARCGRPSPASASGSAANGSTTLTWSIRTVKRRCPTSAVGNVHIIGGGGSDNMVAMTPTAAATPRWPPAAGSALADAIAAFADSMAGAFGSAHVPSPTLGADAMITDATAGALTSVRVPSSAETMQRLRWLVASGCRLRTRALGRPATMVVLSSSHTGRRATRRPRSGTADQVYPCEVCGRGFKRLFNRKVVRTDAWGGRGRHLMRTPGGWGWWCVDTRRATEAAIDTDMPMGPGAAYMTTAARCFCPVVPPSCPRLVAYAQGTLL